MNSSWLFMPQPSSSTSQYHSWTVPVRVLSFYNPFPPPHSHRHQITLSEHCKWLSKWWQQCTRGNFQGSYVPNLRIYQVNPPSSPGPRREDWLKKIGAINTVWEDFFLETFACWVERGGAGAQISHTGDLCPIDKQGPRKPDVIHFIKDDSGDR